MPKSQSVQIGAVPINTNVSFVATLALAFELTHSSPGPARHFTPPAMNHLTRSLFAVFALLLALAVPLQAQNVTYTTGETATGNLVVSFPFQMTFEANASAGDATITNNNNLFFNDISTAGSATITNGAGGTIYSGSNALSLGALSGAGTLTILGNPVAIGGLNTNTTFSGLIGGGGLAKIGSGILTLFGANTFTGPLTLAAGAVRATTQASALGAGTVNFNAGLSGATLALANDTGLNFGRAVAVSETANFVSDRLTAGAAVTHTLGALSLDSAYLTLAPGTNISSGTAGLNFGDTTVANNYATFDVAAGARLTLATLNTLGHSTAFQGAGASVISGDLQSSTDNFEFAKSGSGSLSLSGATNTLETLYQTGGSFIIDGGVTNGKRADINGAGSTATLTGPTSSWTLREQIFVEGNATTAATLTVANGAALAANYIRIGGYTGGNGALVVTGAGSRVSDTATGGNWGLFVGYTGQGSLTISAGGALTSSVVAIGYDRTGSVLLTGSGSSWTVNKDLYFGYVTGGAGSLTVADGATGSSLESFTLGYFGGNGTLTIRDAGSKWTAVNGINVNSGAITLADGGTLQVGSTGVGALFLGNGTTAHFGTGGVSGNLAAANIGVDGALTFNHTDTLAFTTSIYAGSGSIIKQGSGTLVLSGDNAFYAGSINVTGGTLRATTFAGALGSGPLALNGGNLFLANNSALDFGVATAISANTTLTSDRLTTGAGLTHTLGTLTLGAQTLATARGSLATSGTGGLTFGATALSADGAVFDTGANTQLTLGAISGNFAFSKQGAGQLTLATASTRTTATTTVSGGTLRLTNVNALGTTQKNLTLTSGTIQFANDAASAFNGTNLVLGGNATLTADRTTSSTNSRTHSLGTLSLGANTLSITRGTNITGAGTGGLTFGATTLSADGAVFDTGADTQLTLGAISGNFAFSKQGAGQLTLATASTRTTAATTVSGGTFRLTNVNALGTTQKNLTLTSGTVQFANDAASAFNGTNLVLGGNATLTSDRSTTGAARTHTLGTLSIGTHTLTTTRGSLATSGTGGLIIAATTLSGNATFAPGANAVLTLGALNDNAIARTLSKQGAGTLTLATAATSLITGTAVNLTAGTLNLNHSTALGSLANVTLNSGATLALGTGSAPPLGALNGSGGNVTLGSNQLTIGSATNNLASTFGGTLSGTGGLTKSGNGTLTLAGINTFSGGTTIAAGRLLINGSTGNVTVNSGGALGGNGTVSAIALNGGDLAPGNSPGTLNAQSLVWTTGGMVFDLGGNATTSDSLALTGALTGTAGSKLFTFVDNGWVIGNTYDLITFGSASLLIGQLGYTNGGGFGGNFNYAPGKLQFTLTAIPEPSTWALLALSGALAIVVARRRCKAR